MRRLFALAALLALLTSPAVVAADDAGRYVMVVNAGNALAGVDRQFLTDAFLKKTTAWPNGDVIRPVDLPPSSPVRRGFTEDVLHKSVAEVKGYWQQRIFSGRDVPPPELDRDEDVVEYVRAHSGGVGYVSRGARIDGVKPLAVQ
jgi:ABC-type phosphate transport system substrate-binding protein